jgi:hypothetical protein
MSALSPKAHSQSSANSEQCLRHAARSTRVSISPRSAPKSIGLTLSEFQHSRYDSTDDASSIYSIAMSALGQKRTFAVHLPMSVMGQKRTFT